MRTSNYLTACGRTKKANEKRKLAILQDYSLDQSEQSCESRGGSSKPERRKQPRLAKQMTICIAAKYRDRDGEYVVVATDNKISLAGDLSGPVPVLERLISDLPSTENTLQDVRDKCVDIYEDEWAKCKHPANWLLLFYGFDKNKRAHIFSIEDGNVMYHDNVGYCGIGSGKDIAEQYLAAFPYRQINPFWQAVYSVLAAKFQAETATDVGSKWTLALVERAQQDFVLLIDQKLIKKIKAKWEKIPKIPAGVEKLITDNVLGTERFQRLMRGSQQSEPEK
jgi:hypothetical protein